MWWYVGAAVAGALMMGRTKSKTKLKKTEVVGVSSGRTYQVEENLDLRTIFVHSPLGSIGVFVRTRNNTFKMTGGKGDPRDIASMKRDFEPPPPPT